MPREERLSGALTWIADRAGRIADGSYTAEGAERAAEGIRERAISALAVLSIPANEPAGNLDRTLAAASSVGAVSAERVRLLEALDALVQLNATPITQPRIRREHLEAAEEAIRGGLSTADPITGRRREENA